MFRRVMVNYVLLVCLVLMTSVNLWGATAGVSKNSPSAKVAFENSSVDESIERKLKVGVSGVLKRVDPGRNDLATPWLTGTWSKNTSGSVTYSGIQKAKQKAKSYQPKFSGRAGPAPGGGGGGTNQDYEWNVDGKYELLALEIVATPDEYFSYTKLDVPLCISIVGADNKKLTVNDFKAIKVEFTIDNNSITKTLTKQDIFAGNIVDAEIYSGDIFSILIPEAFYNSIMVKSNAHTTNKIKYVVEAVVNYNDTDIPVKSKPYSIALYADKKIICIEIGNDTSYSIEEVANECHFKAKSGYQYIYDNKSGNFWSGEPEEMNVSVSNYKPIITGAFNIYAALSDRYGNAKNNIVRKIRAGCYDNQIGFYFVTYYGYKIINGRKVVDITKASAGFDVYAWAGNAEFEGFVQSEYDVSDPDYPGIALSTIGLIVAIAKPDPISTPLGIASFLYGITGLVPPDKEDGARIYSVNYLLQYGKAGNFVSGLDQEFIMGEKGWGPSGVHSAKWGIPLQDKGIFDFGNRHTKAIRTIVAVNSSAINVTDTSLSWPPIPSTEAKAKLKFKAGDGKVYIKWR